MAGRSVAWKLGALIGNEIPDPFQIVCDLRENDATKSASGSQADAISAQQPHAAGIGGRSFSWLG
jgi:hypothetical protein